jgi:hypothetical protein
VVAVHLDRSNGNSHVACATVVNVAFIPDGKLYSIEKSSSCPYTQRLVHAR